MPRAWYETLSQHLLDNGFIKTEEGAWLLVQVYVDDIIFGSTNHKLCEEFEKIMKSKFQMSSMGELNFFLGLQVNQLSNGTFINQSKYFRNILIRFNLLDCKSCDTHVSTSHKLFPDENGIDVDQHQYRAMIGSLMYLTESRPDIMFGVCICARYQAAPKVSHMEAVKRIFRYLKGRPSLGLWYPKDSNFHFIAYSDSDFGGCNLNRNQLQNKQ